MVEDVVPMAGTSTMIDDVVPISVEGSSRMVENQMPVGSVVTFFFFLIIGLRIRFLFEAKIK